MIYGIVTIASILLSTGFGTYVIDKLKKEGYLPDFKDMSRKEKIITFLPGVLISVVPILNFINLVTLIVAMKKQEVKETLYEKIKDGLIKSGAITENDTFEKETYEEVKVTKEVKKEEPVIRTNQEAREYWANVPTLPTVEELKEEDLGYQKSIGRRK